MVIYLNLHVAMEQLREKAEKNDPPSYGPKVILIFIQFYLRDLLLCNF